MEYHNPVMLDETVGGLDVKEDGVYVDVTFGGGGHSKEILSRLGPKGKLYGFDQDEDAQENALDDERFVLIHQNFRHIKRFLKFYGVQKVDGVLGDFGVSSHQFDVPERGFSTRFDADLDMRISQKSVLSDYDVVNTYDHGDLKRIFGLYGELKNASTIAATIIDGRADQPIKTTEDLKNTLRRLLPAHKENKILAQLYQAIRIEVNQEVAVLREFLMQTPDIMEKGGRLSLISYHSLEDRLVKRFIRSGKFEGEVEKDFYGNPQVPFKKVSGLITPSKEEIGLNSRARSAKLRIAEKL